MSLLRRRSVPVSSKEERDEMEARLKEAKARVRYVERKVRVLAMRGRGEIGEVRG